MTPLKILLTIFELVTAIVIAVMKNPIVLQLGMVLHVKTLVTDSPPFLANRNKQNGQTDSCENSNVVMKGKSKSSE